MKSTLAVTFGDGSLAHRRASSRVASEFYRLSAVGHSIATNRKLISTEFPREAGQILWNLRGMGYWAWKPLVGMYAIRHLTGHGEFLLYADAGCIINGGGDADKTFDKYLQIARETGALTFSSGSGNTDRVYCKRATLETLSFEGLDLDSTQRAATTWIFHKSLAEEFLESWWSFCSKPDLINDDLSDNEDLLFAEHRHDQAIFSLLAKQRSLPMSGDNIDFHPGASSSNLSQKDLPIWASRHRSGCRSYSMNPAIRGLRAIERLIP